MSVFSQLMMRKKVEEMPLTVVGSPTITDGVVSGFSADDFLVLPNINSLSTFEIKMKFKITTNSDSYMNIISTRYQWGLQGFQLKNNTLQAKLRYNYQETNTTKTITQSYDFQENIDYYVKYIFNENNEFYVGISTDDITYTYSSVENIPNGATILLPISSSIGKLSIGVTIQYSAFQGEIDIPNSYIIINGTKYIFTLPQ